MSSGAGSTVVLVVVVLDVVDVLDVVLDVLDVVELDVVELVDDVVLDDVVEVVGVGCTTHPEATMAAAMTNPPMYEPLRRGPRDRAR